MSTVKKYKLLKDLPYIKAGIDYVSADGFNGVFDKCSYVPNKMGMKHERFAIHIDWIENNPEWFSPVIEEEQPQRVEVSALENHSFWVHSGVSKDRYWYQFKASKSIPQEKLKELSNLIERFVNGDDDFEFLRIFRDEFKKAQLYTQSEVDAIRKDAFDKSRLLDVEIYCGKEVGKCLVYKTYNDYLSYLKEQGKEFIAPASLSDHPKCKKEQPTTSVDKGWEIVSFAEHLSETWEKSGYIYPVICGKIGPFSNAMLLNDWLKLPTKLYSIHSVKRTSDGEVFTVGDSIRWGNEVNFKINGFKINNGNSMMCYSHESNTYNIIYAEKLSAK